MIEGLGERLKTERKRCGLKQKDISEKLGMDASGISSYENGSVTPPTDVLIRLATILNVSVDYLLGVEKKKYVVTEGLNDGQIDILQRLINQFKIDNTRN